MDISITLLSRCCGRGYKEFKEITGFCDANNIHYKIVPKKDTKKLRQLDPKARYLVLINGEIYRGKDTLMKYITNTTTTTFKDNIIKK